MGCCCDGGWWGRILRNVSWGMYVYMWLCLLRGDSLRVYDIPAFSSGFSSVLAMDGRELVERVRGGRIVYNVGWLDLQI